MSLKDQFLQKKMLKVAKLAKTDILRNGSAANIFSTFQNKPSEDQIIKMILAGKYGAGDPLSQGGDKFAFEYIIHEFNEEVREKNKLPITMNDSGIGACIISSQNEFFANMLFSFHIDENLFDYIEELNLHDFVLTDTEPFFYIDKENQSVAIQISCVPSIPMSELYKADCFQELGIGENYHPFTKKIHSDLFKNDDLFFWYRIKITTAENIYSENEIEKHNVASHQRKLTSGKITTVTAHERKNPKIIKKQRLNTDEVDYLVYRVFDYKNMVRYYGEGKEERPNHVNSGTSHNFKINQHFFLHGEMKVEIIKRGLSKQESLAIEKFLIQSHKGSELWNIKDNFSTVDFN